MKRFTHVIKSVSAKVKEEGLTIEQPDLDKVFLLGAGQYSVEFSGKMKIKAGKKGIINVKLTNVSGVAWLGKKTIKNAGAGEVEKKWSITLGAQDAPVKKGHYILVVHKCEDDKECDRIIHYVPFVVNGSYGNGSYGGTITAPSPNATVNTDFPASGTYGSGSSPVSASLVDGHQNTYNCGNIYYSVAGDGTLLWNTSFSRIADGAYTLNAHFSDNSTQSISITVSRNTGGG